MAKRPVRKWWKGLLQPSERRRSHSKRRLRRHASEKLEQRRLLAREVSGTLAADDIWSGTIHVTDNVTVPDNVDLRIHPGTIVKFASGRQLIGRGSVDVNGLPTDPVVFNTVNDDSVGEDLTLGDATVGSAGSWNGLYAQSGDWDVRHAEIRYGGAGGFGCFVCS